MKRIVLFLCTLLLFIGGTHDVTIATLTQPADIYGDEAVYEDTGGQYWYPDLGDSRNMFFSEQETFIENLNDSDYYGLDTWHLASQNEFDNLLASMDSYSDVYVYFQPTIIFLDPTIRVYSGIIDDYIVNSPSGSDPEGYTEHAVERFTATVNPNIFTYATPGSTEYKRDDRRYYTVGAWITAAGTPTWPGTDPPSVPEPATMLLLGSGLIGLVGFRRKLKK